MDEQGGDPVCWLDRVCTECGGFREDLTVDTCQRCGASFTNDVEVPDRDRDRTGRARNARPRDGLGRPLPYGAQGVERQPEGIPRAPRDALVEAQRLLDEGMPFHAHEVLEDAWKAAPELERELWRGLAQLAVGLTHAARGNSTGAAALLRRAAENIAPYQDDPPHGIDVTGLTRWSTGHAAELDNAVSVDAIPPSLTTRGRPA